MDPNLTTLLGAAMRWVHLMSIIVLVGGAYYSVRMGPPLGEKFRSTAIAAMALILGSGLFNLLTKVNPPKGYHMWFGIKFLLVLHIFAVTWIAVMPGTDDSKRQRVMRGAVLSATVVVALSGYLRWLSL